MPLYDFRCLSCGERFEAFSAPQTTVRCRACGAPESERVWGGFAGPFAVGLRGAAARRSNAVRRAREEQRRAGFARQREERKQRGE